MSIKNISILVSLLVVCSQSCFAACVVSTQPVLFGDYDVFVAVDLDGVGNIQVTCDNPSDNYIIGMNTGFGSFAQRTMRFGGHSLNYNVFTDAARSTIWGDGSLSTATVSGIGLLSNITIYGRVPALQNVLIGNYTDNLLVTINF
jgi:spore coat protein U-like protein